MADLTENNSPSSPDRNWDVVFCVDGTDSMACAWDAIKSFITQMHANTLDFFDEKFDLNPPKVKLRIRMIIFRDYAYDASPMEESEFFNMPEDSDHLKAFLDTREIEGGGDPAENGLEALYYALRSDFDISDLNHAYQTIVLITDADALDHSDRDWVAGYPWEIPSGLLRVDRDFENTLWRDYGGYNHYDPSAKEYDGYNPDFHCKSPYGDGDLSFYKDLKWCSNRRRHMSIFAPEGTRYERLADELCDNATFHALDRSKGADALNDISSEEFAKTILEDIFLKRR